MCNKNIWDAQISILKKKYNVSIPSLKNIATVDDAVQKIINKNKKKFLLLVFQWEDLLQ
jgi:hypothetical protein